MAKPKIVCRIGSGLLATLAVAAFSAVAGWVLWMLFGVVHYPRWLVWAAYIIGPIPLCWHLWRLYRWFFCKCYKPRFEIGFTTQRATTR